MTQDEKIALLKVMSEETDEDTLVAYLSLSKEKILNKIYPFGIEVGDFPTKYDYKQVELANILLNKRGVEGQTSHSENGISRNYEDEEKILKSITSYCAVVSNENTTQE